MGIIEKRLSELGQTMGLDKTLYVSMQKSPIELYTVLQNTGPLMENGRATPTIR